LCLGPKGVNTGSRITTKDFKLLTSKKLKVELLRQKKDHLKTRRGVLGSQWESEGCQKFPKAEENRWGLKVREKN